MTDMPTTVEESCPCGATIRVSGDSLSVAAQMRRWRRQHADHQAPDANVPVAKPDLSNLGRRERLP